jgi:nanoRNase/pAp phosphatase (c-di-AMP/oligoRNAs hydrolase)
MKIVLMGRGHRMVDILESFHAPRADVAVISTDATTLQGLAGRPVRRVAADPASTTLAEHGLAVGPNDLLLVAEYEEAPLRAILTNLREQHPAAVTLVFTPLPVRELSRQFPEFLIRSDRSLYKTEMRDLIRRTGSQQKVNSVRRIVREAGKAVVVIWGNPDPDALAAAFGLRELLLPDCPDFTISYLGEFTRPENAAMVSMLKIPTVRHTEELARGAATITVDAQPSFFSATGSVTFDVIIDHHPATVLGPHKFADVRPRYGSTSTILTEYYRDSGVRMPRRVATALYYGLKVDTANLTRNVSDADVIAFRFLHPRADANMIRTIELSQLPLSTLDFFQIAIANKKIAGDTAFAFVGAVDNPDICVHIADFFIKLSGISWAAVACRTPEKIVVVFRSDGFRKHAGKVAETVFIDYGTAGGHRTMARAELPLERVRSELTETTDLAVENWLLGKLATKLKGLGKFLNSHTPTTVR